MLWGGVRTALLTHRDRPVNQRPSRSRIGRCHTTQFEGTRGSVWSWGLRRIGIICGSDHVAPTSSEKHPFIVPVCWCTTSSMP